MTSARAVLARLRVMLAALAVWAAAVAVHCLIYVEYYARAAREAKIEEYAYTRSFQLIAFLYFRFPFWLLALAWMLLAVAQRGAKRDDQKSKV